MPADLTNLLPRARQRALSRGYFYRLAAMASVVVAILVFAHGLLLVPSYIYMSQQVQAREAELSALQAASTVGNDEETKARFARLEGDANAVLLRKDEAAGSAAVKALLTVPRTGVVLRSFSFTQAPAGEKDRMLLSGVAASRESLRTYIQALDSQSYIERAELPISAYAEEKNISFTATLTGTFLP